MEHSFRSVLIVLAGVAALVGAIALDAIILESDIWMLTLDFAGGPGSAPTVGREVQIPATGNRHDQERPTINQQAATVPMTNACG